MPVVQIVWLPGPVVGNWKVRPLAIRLIESDPASTITPLPALVCESLFEKTVPVVPIVRSPDKFIPAKLGTLPVVMS
jgi:hypothetical protein